MFQGFNTDDPAKSISLLAGFLITFLGVHLLEISRQPDEQAVGHSALEGGLMNPRLSIQGRMSIDGWNGTAGTAIGAVPSNQGHVRRGSAYRAQTIFNALEDEDEAVDSVGLARLPEAEGEYDDDDEIDERTHLRSDGRRLVQDGARSDSHSPRGSQGDPRRSPH